MRFKFENNHIHSMKTLRFWGKNIENQFKIAHHNSHKKANRIGIYFSIFLLFACAPLDLVFIETNHVFVVYLVRLVMFFILLTGLIISYSRYYQLLWQPLICLGLLMIESGWAFLTIYTPEIAVFYFFPIVIMTSYVVYFLLGILFFQVALFSWLSSIFYIVMLTFFSDIRTIYIINAAEVIIAMNIIAMVAAYRTEYFERNNFYNTFLLRQEESKRLTEEEKRVKWLENVAHFLRHELNNRLVGIKKSLELLSRHTDSQKATKYLDRASQGIQFTDYLLESVAEATSMEASFKNDHFETVCFSELLEYHVSEYKENVSDLVTSIQPQVIIKGNSIRLKELIDKLLSNALDFRTQGTEILISLQSSDKKSVFQVENEGSILPKNPEMLFELFSTLRANKPNAQHMGIGLYVAKLITQHHAGTITAQNKRSGTGVIFTVSIPSTS